MLGGEREIKKVFGFGGVVFFFMVLFGGCSGDCFNVIDYSYVFEFEVVIWVKIIFILVYLVIFVVGIVGNSVIIRVI